MDQFMFADKGYESFLLVNANVCMRTSHVHLF